MCFELSNAVSETYSVQIITKIFASVHSLVQTNNGRLSLQAPASMPPTVNGGDQNTLSCLHATTLSMALLMMDQLLDLMIGIRTSCIGFRMKKLQRGDGRWILFSIAIIQSCDSRIGKEDSRKIRKLLNWFDVALDTNAKSLVSVYCTVHPEPGHDQVVKKS
ncbi:hypothetical protein OIU79_023282 [Salix purpurea]|uniref:Uncharacterized protein n=1 Tax=Salix purpurea TaxID=77065 RepID=A0A9Q1A952_SALPP|nr:hypothetical protein OIU79_023282 [Salix purpurea]